MKNGTAAGVDGIYIEFLKHSGGKVKDWLARLFSDIVDSIQFKLSKILALFKLNKAPDNPKSYSPIAQLSVSLKLLERLILNRIGPAIDDVIPSEQAGFRPSGSCTDQVMDFIEDGFKKTDENGCHFCGFNSSLRHIVWNKGLIFKLIQVIPCLKIINLICSILSDRQTCPPTKILRVGGKSGWEYFLCRGGLFFASAS